MPYDFVADSIPTKKFCSRPSSEVKFLTENLHFEFLNATPFSGLEATYAVHLWLIGKCVVDFLVIIIEHFSLGVRADEIRANTELKSAFCTNGVSLA